MVQRARVVAALAGKTLPFPAEVQRRLSFFVNENWSLMPLAEVLAEFRARPAESEHRRALDWTPPS